MTKNKIFDAFNTPLNLGSNLIEASAGTGKTFAIAMLVVRFIVEKQIKIDEIIVTTFTKAATSELKDRIRARIREALLLAKGKINQVKDQDLKDWFQNLDVTSKQGAEKQLSNALLNMDQATIFTIHGFCQRMLSDFALEGGQLFDLDLIENIEEIFEQVAEDYWRKNLYYADEFVIQTVLRSYASPEILLKSIRNAYMIDHVLPENTEIDDFDKHLLEQKLKSAIKNLSIFSDILKLENQAYFKKSEWSQYQKVMGCAESLLEHSSLFTEQGLFNALSGTKLRGAKKQKFVNDYQLDFQVFEAVHQVLVKSRKDIILKTRLNLLSMLKLEVPQRLKARNAIGFDDIITTLAVAILDIDSGLVLKIKQRYKAALIDEFQDTDKRQWDIFSNLFMYSTSHYLYLIGDPKQAIYKFRGADIFTYLKVAQQVDQKYTLAKNWRSHPWVVSGVNILFAQIDKPFVIDKFEFNAVQAAKSKDDGQIITANGQAAPPIQLWVNRDKKNIFQLVADEIICLLSSSYKLKKNGVEQPIKANDIAILVSSHNNANKYRSALQQANISVVSGKAVSVFTSVDAQHLLKILSAICYPSNIAYVKTMLSIDYFGLNGVDFHHDYLQSEDKFDALLMNLEAYHTMWLEHGFMCMMQKFLAGEGINQKILDLKFFERRLTDLFHLIELVQHAIITENLGIFKTLEWLQQKVSENGAKQNNDEHRIRLDSEREAVSVVTMHSSKGLEYPIVFCPDLGVPSRHQDKDFLNFNQEGLGQVVDIGSDQFEENFKTVVIENLSEKMRLLYVALTRSKYLCYLIWEQSKDKLPLNYTNHSGFSYLLGLNYRNDDITIKRHLIGFVEQYPDIFKYVEVKEVLNSVFKPEQGNVINDVAYKMKLSQKYLSKKINDCWQITSYTALSQLSEGVERNISDSLILKTDDKILFSDNRQDEVRDIENYLDEHIETELIAYVDIPKGAAAGNLIHSMLEKFSFYALSQEVCSDAINEEIKKLCERFSVPDNCLEQIQELLRTVVTAPINVLGNNSLSQLINKNSLKEMPFYLSVSKFNTLSINKILGNELTYQPLGYKKIEGFLTGFIDLIFIHNGKYYLADYKSNTLNDYSLDSMNSAMKDHNYGLQLWIYTVVLHRFLEQSLSGYDYEKHFGGVFYLFVRGISHLDSSLGVYFERPKYKKIEQFNKLLTSKVAV